MKFTWLLAAWPLFLLSFSVLAQKNTLVTSPDGRIVFSFSTKSRPLTYSVSYKNKILITPSVLNLKFDSGNSLRHIRIRKTIFRDTTESYELIVGKSSHVQSHYREAIIPIEETSIPFRKINIVVRAFNDGIAFRYEFLSRQNSDTFLLTDEETEFRLSGNPFVHALLLPSYTSSHEGFYTRSSWNEIPGDTLMDMPALFEFPGKTYMAITEASLLDYAGMYLLKKDNVLRGVLAPLPTQTLVKVRGRFPHRSPWRVMMISDRIGALIESNILTSLCEPSRLEDANWLRPGKTTFPWWNGNVLPDTINAPGNNFVTQQYYIDFCARNNIRFHSVVEYGLHQWYTDDGIGFQPGPHSDVTRPVPGLNMKEICDYAKSKGVEVRVWVHWAALYPRLDSAFAIFQQWGLSGMMIDFMDRDDQEMVNIQTEMLEKAAKHHLHIQFHGAYKPTGLSRTWPNEFTREGTLNYEVNKWGPGLPPDHDLNIVFTRMLAGSTDYHLGGFRAVPDSLYKAQYTRPLMLGTRCHMLAMYVILENAVAMVCDYPAAYEGEPGFEFIRDVPTVWDETKVIDAKVDQYAVIARRKGKDWYIGGITNHDSRTLNLALDFLEAGSYSADIFTDSTDDGKLPDRLNKQIKTVNNEGNITITLAANGGAAVHLKKEP